MPAISSGSAELLDHVCIDLTLPECSCLLISLELTCMNAIIGQVYGLGSILVMVLADVWMEICYGPA